ncbi:MAG: type III pantothenate kinase [Bacteroidota bacterium]
MNLVIDLGNTLSKVALFNENDLSKKISFKNLTKEKLKILCRKHPKIKNVILSSVIDHPKKISDFLKDNFISSRKKRDSIFIELSYKTKLPLENLYRSPKTFGKDRLAAAVGANMMFRNQNVLVIDAGTCIKYDFVNAKNQYLGGGISPGIEMRLKALNKFTDKLPLINYKSFDKLIGQNTKESILSGVINGVTEEVHGIISRYKKQYPNIKIVFTGGYSNFFEKINNIFVDPFLVMKGLNHILNFNEQK